MAHFCPQCSQENIDNSIFCTRCGYRFPTQENAGDARQVSFDNYAPIPTPPTGPPPPQQGYADQTTGALKQGNQPPDALPDVPRSYRGPGNDPYGAPGALYGPTRPQQQQQMPSPGMQPPSQPAPRPPKSPQRSSVDLTVVQRAFAGKGTPVTHASWLIDGKQIAPTDLRTTLVEKVYQRYPNEVKASSERLQERDAVLEERDYVKIERAPASVFVYFTRFGPDLYIARTTTVRPVLSPVRIAVLGLLFLLMLIGYILAAAIQPSVLDIGNFLGAFQFKFIISLLSTLLLIFFITLGLRSLVLGLTEKDYLGVLRPGRLNDFRLDDGALLEHVADNCTREVVEGLGLDADALAQPPRNYPARQSLHLL
jgi:zinc-ribbon domain